MTLPSSRLTVLGARGRWNTAVLSRFEVALAAIVLCGLWCGIAGYLQHERRALKLGAGIQTRSLTNATAESLERAIDQIDHTLLFIRTAYAHDPARFDVGAWNRDAGFIGRGAFRVAMVDGTGTLQQSTSLAPGHAGMNLADREHIRAQLDSQGDALFVSKPVLERQSGRWSIHFTRKLFAPDGGLAGVVVISMFPALLTSNYEGLGLKGNLLTLVGLDGIVRARAPDGESTIGHDLTGSPVLRAAARARDGTLSTRSPIDDMERIVSFRRLDAGPLLVMVGADKRTIFAPYRRDLVVLPLAGILLSMIGLWLAWALLCSQRRLVASRAALSDAVENISQGLVMVDRLGAVPVANERAEALLGRSSAGIDLSRPVPVDDPDLVHELRQTLLRLQQSAAPQEEIAERAGADGTVLEVRTRPVRDGGFVRTYTDITQRKQTEQRIQQMAHHDPLTGLGNRALLQLRLEEAWSRASRQDGQLALLFLDLDRFKLVNDTLGHAIGDQLLMQVADRLRLTLRSGDLVARVGGDEFVVIIEEGCCPELVAKFAERLVEVLSRPVALDGHQMDVSVSIGIALFPQNGADPETLLQNADIALYRAKEEGRATFRFFEAAMARRVQERHALEHDLRRAIGTDQLHLQYQPLFAAESGAVLGFEALLRWDNPRLGAVSPATFIPLAEESDLIVSLGRWVLETACHAAVDWPDHCCVSVNLSPAELHRTDFVDNVVQTLRRTGLPATRLLLEVTENTLIRDTAQTLDVLNTLHGQGVQLALDDFGTGYSSLSYVRRFPFDKLKLDRSFVQMLTEDAATRAIVRAILVMSHELGLSVIAEGVETQDQLDLLREQGCDEIQGYLLGHPMCLAACSELLHSARRTRRLTTPSF